MRNKTVLHSSLLKDMSYNLPLINSISKNDFELTTLRFPDSVLIGQFVSILANEKQIALIDQDLSKVIIMEHNGEEISALKILKASSIPLKSIYQAQTGDTTNEGLIAFNEIVNSVKKEIPNVFKLEGGILQMDTLFVNYSILLPSEPRSVILKSHHFILKIYDGKFQSASYLPTDLKSSYNPVVTIAFAKRGNRYLLPQLGDVAHSDSNDCSKILVVAKESGSQISDFSFAKVCLSSKDFNVPMDKLFDKTIDFSGSAFFFSNFPIIYSIDSFTRNDLAFKDLNMTLDDKEIPRNGIIINTASYDGSLLKAVIYEGESDTYYTYFMDAAKNTVIQKLPLIKYSEYVPRSQIEEMSSNQY
ncbi:MAG: hypothetical protein M3Q97_09810, partial [Bacteroidota bacterium]|nr:hypothetical protein [Bacteroidota bacterium]